MSVAFAGNSTTGSSREAGPLRVMIVDDSVVIRGLISRWIGAEHDMEVAASLRTGLEAVNQIERINPDVAVLDIEMPRAGRHLGAAAIAGEEARSRHHHGLDADPP
ncbi:DNA-binding NarL/FixJ family response regulator [Bradyrhizobium sp. LB1.3]